MAKEIIESGAFCHFRELGVWVTIPPQGDKSLEIEGPLAYDKLENKVSDHSGEFELIRLAINFQVKADGEIVKSFSPPMVLEVGLTDYDFGHQPDGRVPTLAFWDPKEAHWKVFADQGLDTRDATIVAKARVKDWGDPAVGVGRFQ